MTPASCLVLVRSLCDSDEFRAFGFSPASVMAFCEIESGFDENAYRYEPRLGEGSYGLTQVLLGTARQCGWRGSDPAELYDPETNLRTGMRYMRWIWDFLKLRLARAPTLAEWSAAYNEGPGNVLRGRTDPAYSDKWLAARERWLAQLSESA
jgi:soluble lytic murein transglycosylase-like protein